MDKGQLIKKLEQSWTALQQACAGFSDAQLTQPGVAGEWSIKDILGHVTTWEQEALKFLPLILQGGRPPRYKDLYGGIDAFNRMQSEQKRSLSLADVLQQHVETHRRLIAYLQSAPDEQFTRETRFRRRLRLDTYSHYPTHTKGILDWRKRSNL